MPSPPDRISPDLLEQTLPAYPLPPLNLVCSSSFQRESFDLRWDSPAQLSANTGFNVVGVNVYRSFDSEFGPFFRLNVLPVGATFYRDRTRVIQVLQEDVSARFDARGTADPGRKWAFRTKNKPIVISPSPGLAGCTNLNVQVTVNGVAAFVQSIQSATGEVELRNFPTFDNASQKQLNPVLPTGTSDVVLASYRYEANQVKTDLGQRIFYRLTTVARDDSTGLLFETPMDRGAQTNNLEVGKVDYIWREATRRNRFILDHGGERVKLFIRKAVGPRCGCYSDLHRQPNADCPVCFGTGILGGYDGPFDISIAPDDGAKNIEQSARGRRLLHTYDTWTNPSPLLSQRDFIVKINGDRYGIGPVRMPRNRGMPLNQFFPISHLDEADIRYQVPVLDTASLVAPQTRWALPGTGNSTPMVTDRPNIPAERQIRGTDVTWDNTQRR